jgi:hypothetical protein
MIEVGSNVRITVGTRQVYGSVLRIYNRGGLSQEYSPNYPNVYWDIEYEIDNPAPGRGSIGRYKQNCDGGYLSLQ